MARRTPGARAVEPQAPVATEPGCTHPDCVLAHPHAGPAQLAGDTDHAVAGRHAADAQAEPHARAVADVPAAGYVIAAADLRVPGGARAHRPGDRVPVGNVARNGWQDLVLPATGE